MPQSDSEQVLTVDSDIELETVFGVFRAVHMHFQKKDGVILTPMHVPLDQEPRLRIQSSCLFSETFRAMDCDCAAQLHESLHRTTRHGGAVVYLYEEGRGVGLANKMKAIHLQQAEGLTSTEAYARLGLSSDARVDYNFVNIALRQLFGDLRWTLLTNNPLKESLARSSGLSIAATEQLICHSGKPAIKAYLEGKAAQFGHNIKENDEIS